MKNKRDAEVDKNQEMGSRRQSSHNLFMNPNKYQPIPPLAKRITYTKSTKSL